MAKLIMVTKKGRHRKEHAFPIEFDATQDPIARAAAISTATASLLDPVVNWRIEE